MLENVTFNLEPENPDNYTTTEEEYEVEVPVLRPDGPVTADLVDGEARAGDAKPSPAPVR